VVGSLVHPDSNTAHPVLLGTGHKSKPFSREVALCGHCVNTAIHTVFEQAPLGEKRLFFFL